MSWLGCWRVIPCRSIRRRQASIANYPVSSRECWRANLSGGRTTSRRSAVSSPRFGSASPRTSRRSLEQRRRLANRRECDDGRGQRESSCSVSLLRQSCGARRAVSPSALRKARLARRPPSPGRRPQSPIRSLHHLLRIPARLRERRIRLVTTAGLLPTRGIRGPDARWLEVRTLPPLLRHPSFRHSPRRLGPAYHLSGSRFLPNRGSPSHPSRHRRRRLRRRVPRRRPAPPANVPESAARVAAGPVRGSSHCRHASTLRDGL